MIHWLRKKLHFAWLFVKYISKLKKLSKYLIFILHRLIFSYTYYLFIIHLQINILIYILIYSSFLIYDFY